jgi:DNA-directed RNA polymerase subunit RPC12/RpoP
VDIGRPIGGSGLAAVVCPHCGFASAGQRALYCPKCGMRMVRG